MSSHFDTMRYDPSRDADFWSDAAPAAATTTTLPARTQTGRGGNVGGSDPLDKLRRTLRGRWPVAAVLALVGALFGAALGWMSQHPVYEADGSAMIPPAVPSYTGGEFGNPNYKSFMQTEAEYAESEPMALQAMEQPIWKQAVDRPWAPTNFVGAANALHNGNDSLLRFQFKSSDPKVARAGVVALMNAYEAHFLDQRTRTGGVRAKEIRGQLEVLDQRAGDNEAEIGGISQTWGSENLGPTRDEINRRRGEKAIELRNVELNLEAAMGAKERAVADPESITDADLAGYNEEMATLLKERGRVFAQIQALDAAGMGKNQATYVRAQKYSEGVEANIRDLTKRLKGQYFGKVPVLTPGFGSAVERPVDAAYIAQLEAQKAKVGEELTDLDAQQKKVVTDESQLTSLTATRDSINQQRDQLNKIVKDETQNSAFQEAVGTIRLYPPSPAAVFIAKDKRKAMALGGAILGFGVPAGPGAAVRHARFSRFRYSDDATDNAVRAPLLGILPNLPDRLSDPNQASIAAHCVHQIRTMLQINHGSDEPRAFAVTSAQRGDGKTSLALALGLSYAASGARTLLVDTDLQSGGLSHRLGVGGDEGVMDALSGGELLQYVCETDVTDLAILPIGRGVANHAGAFSPGAVRHLMEQAKRRYDVIVCDTGPILGSIESTPIVAATDGVVLAVSRGQSRPMVDKALAHLGNVGATVAGMVFNRAQAADFERSVSGMNLRGGSAAGRLAGKNGRAKPAKKPASKLVQAGQN